MMKWIWIFLLAAACTTTPAQKIERIDNHELVELMKDESLQLVDVRTPEEVAEGIIKGAQHIDIYDPQFMDKVGAFDREKPIVVYCAAGSRSANATDKLKELGFLHIYDLRGGAKGWATEGHELVRTE